MVYVTSMKTETLLTSSKGFHDEGGIINLKDKRLCSVQEPDHAISGVQAQLFTNQKTNNRSPYIQRN